MSVDSNEKVNRKSFFKSDTIYMIDFLAAETGFSSQIIWDKNSSCFYDYSYEMVDWKKINEKIEIRTDASDILKSFDMEFRKLIEFGDTLGYHKYADKHKVFDGEWVSPVRAIKEERPLEIYLFLKATDGL